MAVVLWAVGLSLLMQTCRCSVRQITSGCMTWGVQGDDVCCEACHPGNRLVKECGPLPKELCTPCEPDTFTDKPKNGRCARCTQCVGALVEVKACTATADTQCGCKEGLICGDPRCSFCVTKCGKGHEPTENRSCRPCPDGTFNDQVFQKCRPWSTTCPKPGESIIAKGDAFHDIKCGNSTQIPGSCVVLPDTRVEAWPLGVLVPISVALLAFSIIFIIVAFATLRMNKRRKKVKRTITRSPIIRTPTDDPRTLIAVECSFHEADEGSSSMQTG